MKKEWLFYGIPAVFSVLIFLIFPDWEVDDAYIILRYAKNWVESGSPVWNLAEDPVEGYTGFIWVSLSAVFLKLGLNPLTWLKGMGFVSFFGSFLLLIIIGKQLNWNKWITLAVLFSFSFSGCLYTHAGSGLETSFFMFSVLLCLQRFLFTESKGDSPFLSNLFLGLALLICGLTRPEGVLIALVITGSVLIRAMKRPEGRKKVIVSLLISYFVPAAVYFVLRWRFYGQFLPNTYYAKAYEGYFNFEVMITAFRFGLHYLTGPILISLLLIGTLIKKKLHAEKGFPALKRPLFVSIGVFLLLLLLSYGRSHLYMGYSFRFFAPFLPLLFVFFATFINDLMPQFSSRKKLFGWLSMIILILQLALYARKIDQELSFTREYKTIMTETLTPTAEYLETAFSSNSDPKVAVYMDVGKISYSSDLHIIDFGRLNDKTLSHLPWGGTEAIDYFFAQKADAAVFTSFHPDTLEYIPEAEKIISDPRFSDYERTAVFGGMSTRPYYQFVYLRRNSSN